MKRFIGAAVAAAVAALAAPAGAQTTLTLGGSDAIGTVIDRGNAMFTKLVNERAAGKLKVNFIQGEQLGNDVQVIEQTMHGSVHVYGDVLDWYANWVKDFAMLAWGFTFRDDDHMEKFLEVRPVPGDGGGAAQEAGPAHPRRRADAAAHPVRQEAGRLAGRPERT